MDRIEQLAGRLARNCNLLADREDLLEVAGAVGELTDELLGRCAPEPEAPETPAAKTVLLVDEPGDREPLVRMLSAHGCLVIEAGTGAEAMALAERHSAPIHLLLTNVILPDLSGRELAERLSLLRPEMSEIYMSGYTDEEVLFFGLLGPGMATVQKPVVAADLFRSIERALEAQYALR